MEGGIFQEVVASSWRRVWEAVASVYSEVVASILEGVAAPSREREATSFLKGVAALSWEGEVAPFLAEVAASCWGVAAASFLAEVAASSWGVAAGLGVVLGEGVSGLWATPAKQLSYYFP